MYNRLVIAAVATVLGAGAVDAAVSVTSTAGNTITAGPGTLITFDSAIPAAFTVSGSGYTIQSGSNSVGASPAGDASQYLSVYNGSYRLLGSTGYGSVSLYWGSIDTYNFLDLLDAGGSVIGTVSSSMIPSSGSGSQSADETNRRVNIASTQAIYGLNFRSDQAAFETDDVKFQAAVPEPASWAMMVGGFGLLGAAMRRRRETTAVRFA